MEFADMYQEACTCKYRIDDICTCEVFIRTRYGLPAILEGPQRMCGDNVYSLDDRIVGGQL